MGYWRNTSNNKTLGIIQFPLSLEALRYQRFWGIFVGSRRVVIQQVMVLEPVRQLQDFSNLTSHEGKTYQQWSLFIPWFEPTRAKLPFKTRQQSQSTFSLATSEFFMVQLMMKRWVVKQGKNKCPIAFLRQSFLGQFDDIQPQQEASLIRYGLCNCSFRGRPRRKRIQWRTIKLVKWFSFLNLTRHRFNSCGIFPVDLSIQNDIKKEIILCGSLLTMQVGT